jgi:Neurotransmitter-gated ion-channel ligand binding domain
MQNLDTHDLQFKLQMRFQLRYYDSRLEFKKVNSNRTIAIIGEDELRMDIWVPHYFFVNERSSELLGFQSKDVITSISPDGMVTISSRLQISLYCSMHFQKFPFDRQRCHSNIGSWMLNSSEIKLHWEKDSPFKMSDDKILTEYNVINIELKELEIEANNPGLQYGDFVGNYSSLQFMITLDRQVGYYLLEYFFPSMMLVAISWVSFWLQADQTYVSNILTNSGF